MRYFSMFTGVGGFELGFKYANKTIGFDKFKCIGFSEIDKYSNQVLKYRFPEVKNYGDATKINPNKLPDFDMLCGGFPCQSFSIAGKRGGFKDTRGTLFFEIARILKVKKPKLVLLENVKGLLNHDKGETFKVILQTLGELGYGVQWVVLNSKFFGVPQNRERVFIIGNLRKTSKPKILPFREKGRKTNSSKEFPEPISNCLRTNYSNGKSNETYIKQLNNPKHSNNRIYSEKGLSPSLNTMQGGSRQPKIKLKTNTKLGYDIAESRKDGIRLQFLESTTARGRVIKGASQALQTGSIPGVLDNKIRRLTPIECCRLQGFPDDWVDWGIDNEGNKVKISDTQKYKMMGNAVTTNVIKAIGEKLSLFLKKMSEV